LASEVGKNSLDRSKPMREAALNPAITIIAGEIGLWARNTTYSFRTTAIVETRRVEGTEFAQQLAGHVPGGTAICSYDAVGLSDVDITALRLGEEGISRAEIRTMFAQINTPKVDITRALMEDLKEYVSREMRSHERYIQAESAFNDR
jgi:hypothetical protein